MEADLKRIDLVAEVLDARIPVSSRNPDIDHIVSGKPRLIILNRADQADPAGNKAWGTYFRGKGMWVLETDAKNGKGVEKFSSTVQTALAEDIARWRSKGQVGRPIRAMVVGIPNVGKSTFINKIARRKSAKAGDKPGVTRGKQWVAVDSTLDLLDTPGILWPKFEDERIGMNLAFTGAVKDDILDSETLASHLMTLLARRYPYALENRYGISPPDWSEICNDYDEKSAPVVYGYEILQKAAKKRGFLVSGGEADTERMARVLLDEFRGGKLGNFTLEWPEDEK